MGAGNAISEQYNQDMENQEDSGWGTYAKIGLIDPIVVGAQGVVLGLVVGSALVGAGRLVSIGRNLAGKMYKPKVLMPQPKALSVGDNVKYYRVQGGNGRGGKVIQQRIILMKMVL